MLTKRELAKELDRDLALKGLTETYEDIAVTRMQWVRNSVIATRIFLDGVTEIYSLAKAAYLKQLSFVVNKKQREKELSFIRRNQKTVIVLISGNQSLLGNIIVQSYKVFLAAINQVESDHVILGKIGAYMAESARPTVPYKRFPLNDYELVDFEIKAIVDYISQYERIFVVYPRFESVLKQVPQVDDISGGIKIEQSFESKKAYYFEPSARDVMQYFEGQIIGTLFKQKVLESQLARYAARLSIMDQASTTITKLVNQTLASERMVGRRESNKKLLNSFAGISLWTK